MIEQPVRFGPDGRLVGTLTRPESAETGWAILLTNAGVIHRVGPHRINVKIARQAAALGCASLRLDLSGLGDSGAAQESRPWEEQAVGDLRAGIDFLQAATLATCFAVIGICSGADNGLAAALDDSRVAALFLIDPYAYPTWKTSLVHAVRALRPLRAVRRLPGWLSEKSAHLLAVVMRLLGRDHAELREDFKRHVPSPEAFANQLQQLVERGVDVSLLYSGSLHTSYNYAGQFADVFGRERFFDKVHCDYARDIDHTLTTLHAQRLLLEKLMRWVRTLVPGASPAGGAGRSEFELQKRSGRAN